MIVTLGQHLLPLNTQIPSSIILPLVLFLQEILVNLIVVWTLFLLTISLHQIMLLLILKRMIKFSWRLVRNLFLSHFTKKGLMKDVEGTLSLSISYEGSSRHRSEKSLIQTIHSESLSTNQSTLKKSKKANRIGSRSIKEKMRKERMKRKPRRKKTTNLLLMVMTTTTKIFWSSNIHLIFVFF